MLKFLEGSAARTDPVSTDARAQAVLSQSDWRQLVALMLDMCRGEEAPRHAAWAMRAIQMALAQSARPQPGRVEASGLVAETCWLVPQVTGDDKARAASKRVVVALQSACVERTCVHC